MNKLLCVDCDSTLSSIEGVDELAALRGPEVEAAVVDLTNQAMNGEIALDQIFAKRLELIQPTQQLSEQIGQQYIETLMPGVRECFRNLTQQGWRIVIISGGFQQLIEPLAAELDISEVYAVPLLFNQEGDYAGFDSSAPTARNGGKPEVVAQLKDKWQSDLVVMLGDGVSDLETKPVVDLFIGFGGVVKRAKVEQGADVFITEFSELEAVLNKPSKD